MPRILIVDDEQATVDLLEGFLRHWGFLDLVSTTDPSETIDLCFATRPDLILLDMAMPQPDGYRLLRLLAPWRGAADGEPGVIALIDGEDPWAPQRAVALGAGDLLRKPLDPVELKVRLVNQLRGRRLRREADQAPASAEAALPAWAREIEATSNEGLERLAHIAEYREDPTGQHPRRVGRMAALLARELGWLDEEAEALRQAAALHDIGKIGLPDTLLTRPGKLSHEEFEAVKEHTLRGAELLAGAGSNVLRLAKQIALTHHERWDGAGYPTGLRGDEIPMSGRIVALADAYDALTHARPRREAFSPERALAMIGQAGGRQFDPVVVEAFESLERRGLIDAPAHGPRPSGRHPIRRLRYTED